MGIPGVSGGLPEAPGTQDKLKQIDRNLKEIIKQWRKGRGPITQLYFRSKYDLRRNYNPDLGRNRPKIIDTPRPGEGGQETNKQRP